MKSLLSLLLVVTIIISTEQSSVAVAPRVQVNAILKNAAVITINGRQQMLRKNAITTEGYKLVDIGETSVTLMVSGQAMDFKLGAAITSSKSTTVVKQQVQLSRDSRGMFFTSGMINSFPVNFIIDTGATYVAMNSVLAKQIGIDYQRFGTITQAKTASGIVNAWKVSLTSVSIGELDLKFVDALIIEGNFPDITLLGMSFLSRVKIKDDGLLLTIEAKF